MPFLLLIPPLLFLLQFYYLRASGPIVLSLLFIEFPLLLGFLEIYHGQFLRIEQWGRYVRYLLFIILFTTFLVFILLIPDTFYKAWLVLLQAGKARGNISFVFAYALGIVSSFGCANLILHRYRKTSLLDLLLLVNLVMLILYPQPGAFIPFLILTGFKLVINQGSPRNGVKSLINIVFLIIPALIFAFALPMETRPPLGNPGIDIISGGLQKSMAALFPDLPLILNVPGYGSSYGTSRKSGERPMLSSQVMFTLEGANSVLYLRTDIFYSRTDQGWIPEINKVPVKTDKVPDTSQLKPCTLTLQTDLYTRLPVNGTTEYIKYNNSFYAISEDTAFLPPGKLPLIRGDVVTLFNGKGHSFSSEQSESESRRSLNLPEDLKISLSPLAESLRGSDTTESLSNIKSYLINNFSYSLDTHPSKDMVRNFLFQTHRGYCVHFSTAAVLLARTLGIPVRIAEGFLVQIPPDAEDEEMPHHMVRTTASVTGFSAHQWPEILMDGMWSPWEVTPPFSNLKEGKVDTEQDSYTRNQLDFLGLSPEAGRGVDDHKDFKFLGLLPFVFITGSGLFLFIGIFIIIQFRTSLSQRNLKKSLRKLALRGEQKWGLPHPAAIGWKGWFRLYSDMNPEQISLKPEWEALILKYLYNKEPLSDPEKVCLLKGIQILSSTQSPRKSRGH